MSSFFENKSSNEIKLLLSRLLTRSGDQAWDFVVPFALLAIYPGKIQIAAIYYLVIKIGTFLITPAAGKWIDSNHRALIIRMGIFLQFLAVLGGLLCFFTLAKFTTDTTSLLSPNVFPLFSLLCLFGILASMGSVITDIAVGNDLAPALIHPDRLTRFNSWLRRIDLSTEVCAPIVAGILFSLLSASNQFFGLTLIAGWNLISFIPEYLLLSHILKKSDLRQKAINRSKGWSEIFQIDIKSSFGNPIFWLIASYALLWLSVLSPHGVLLTAYLKDLINLPEPEIGVFRGLGAIFGLISTLTFPFFVRKLGLIKSSKLHLGFQAVVLIFGLAAFESGYFGGIYIFLACVLLSRIGLYGFSNGEFELRQRLIPEAQRGELNSLSYLATTFATLILFGVGSLLPTTEDFKYMVYLSIAAVIAANFVFHRWAQGIGKI